MKAVSILLFSSLSLSFSLYGISIESINFFHSLTSTQQKQINNVYDKLYGKLANEVSKNMGKFDKIMRENNSPINQTIQLGSARLFVKFKKLPDILDHQRLQSVKYLAELLADSYRPVFDYSKSGTQYVTLEITLDIETNINVIDVIINGRLTLIDTSNMRKLR